jgi:hypothetical protein
MAAVSIGNSELFALRLLLSQVHAREWAELRTVNGCTWPSFADAPREHGLNLNSQHEAEIAIESAIGLHRPPSDIRFLFVLVAQFAARYTILRERFDKDMRDVGESDSVLNDKTASVMQRVSGQGSVIIRTISWARICSANSETFGDTFPGTKTCHYEH